MYVCVCMCVIIFKHFKLFRCRKRQVMSRPGSARRERSRRGGSATGPGLGTITVDTLWDTRCWTRVVGHVSTSFNIFRHVDVGNWRLADRDMPRHVETCRDIGLCHVDDVPMCRGILHCVVMPCDVCDVFVVHLVVHLRYQAGPASHDLRARQLERQIR